MLTVLPRMRKLTIVSFLVALVSLVSLALWFTRPGRHEKARSAQQSAERTAMTAMRDASPSVPPPPGIDKGDDRVRIQAAADQREARWRHRTRVEHARIAMEKAQAALRQIP